MYYIYISKLGPRNGGDSCTLMTIHKLDTKEVTQRAVKEIRKTELTIFSFFVFLTFTQLNN